MKDDPPKNWFINHYHCSDCNEDWDDEWECTCDDKCPKCNKAYQPYKSENITEILKNET